MQYAGEERMWVQVGLTRQQDHLFHTTTGHQPADHHRHACLMCRSVYAGTFKGIIVLIPIP